VHLGASNVAEPMLRALAWQVGERKAEVGNIGYFA